MRATATKAKTVSTPTAMAAAYPPEVGGEVVSNSKKKKKKKGKGKALDVDHQKVVGAVRGPTDGLVDGEDEGIDDDDDLPALESTGDHHHNHHNHYHHHRHTHPDHNHPHINHNHHHHGPRRTGLSPELESVHLNTTAKLNASAQAAFRMTSTASAQAELLAAANELYRRMESETRDPLLDGGGRDGSETNSSEYWAQLPNDIRSFVQTTYAHGAAMSASERQKSEAMLALARTMVGEAHSRAGFGSAPGVGPPSFDPALLSDPEFQRIVAMSRPPRNMNRFDEYGANEYYSDNEDLDDLEDVEREQRMLQQQQQYESTNDGTTNATSKKKKKKKKKGGASQQSLQQTQQPTQHTQTHPPPTSNPNLTVQPHPPSMPAAPTITRAPPSAAQPPPSSRAAGKQPVYNANLPSSTATTTNTVRTNSTSTARSTSKNPSSTTTKSTTAPATNGAPTTSIASTKEKNKLWSNSSEEERERIKEFWLGLGEAERRDLVKLEKEAVLKKMKEQQKHSCSCAVCGRKRNAIEEELEVLYDAYYEELEQYANHQQQFLVSGGKITPPPGPGPFPGSVALDSTGALVTGRQHSKHANNARVNGNGKVEYDEEEYDEEEEEEYEEDDDLEDDEGSDEDGSDPPLSKAAVHRRGHGGVGVVNGRGPPRRSGGRDDFLNFGSLTAAGPGNILTVADDLLKNDGQKFLEMMEQLAERRMQREEEAAREVEVDSEEDDEEDGSEDDEDEDDGEDDESEEEDEVLSEEQKMEEGRRMFSIFAARMFEQRVLNAYRERVASRRQEEFLKELEDEGKLQAERDAKKQKENQKKKDKKKLQKLVKEAEKAKKDAEKAAEEAALKSKQEAAEEEARKKREEEKAKREAERKTKEEERARQAEERRQRIAEQKAIEAEKRRDREEREKKEKLARQEREAQQRAEKTERERKAREERLAKEAKEKEEREKKEKEERERKERERTEREKADQKRKEESAAAIAAANAAAAANAGRVKAAQQAAQAQAQIQSSNHPPLSPRSGSFPPGTIGAMQNHKQKVMPPMPNVKMPSMVAGPSVPRQPHMPANLARPPLPQTRPMMPSPHPMGGPPPMNIPIPSQIPIMPMGFNPHVSPIAMSPSGRFPSGQPFGPIVSFVHGPPPSQPQQQPMMNGNVRNFAMDFPPPTPFDHPHQSQQVTPVLGSRASLSGPSSSATPSSTHPVTNGPLPQGLTGAPGPNNAPTTSPHSGLPSVHSRRQSASVTSASFGSIRTIGKHSPSTIAFGPSSVIGDEDRAIQPPSSRMRASMDDQQVLGSSALVDENDEIVDLSEIKRRGIMGGAVGPAAKNIWATNGTGKGGGWPAAPISSSVWSAPGFPAAPGGPARPPPSQQQQPAPERLRSPFLPS